MIRIGIVGDIGSGKTYVSKQFGFPVFNADLEVSKIYKKNKKCFKKLNKIFPNYIHSFPIKKKEILKVIFKKKNNIKKINKIVHLEVRSEMNKFLKKNIKKKAVILDIPLLLENKINNKKDIIVFVKSEKKEVKKRLKKRKNFNPEILKKLKKLQLPIEIKKKKSDYVLKNDFKHMLVKKNVKMLKKKIFKYDRNNSRY
tara:strand:+ start:24 stop:620 length:597 start_codon:yes stop_codon:yes gene_type:complete